MSKKNTTTKAIQADVDAKLADAKETVNEILAQKLPETITLQAYQAISAQFQTAKERAHLAKLTLGRAERAFQLREKEQLHLLDLMCIMEKEISKKLTA